MGKDGVAGLMVSVALTSHPWGGGGEVVSIGVWGGGAVMGVASEDAASHEDIDT